MSLTRCVFFIHAQISNDIFDLKRVLPLFQQAAFLSVVLLRLVNSITHPSHPRVISPALRLHKIGLIPKRELREKWRNQDQNHPLYERMCQVASTAQKRQSLSCNTCFQCHLQAIAGRQKRQSLSESALKSIDCPKVQIG